MGERPPEKVISGTIVFIPPGTAQRITNLGTSDLIFLAICMPHFTPEIYEDLDVNVPIGTPWFLLRKILIDSFPPASQGGS